MSQQVQPHRAAVRSAARLEKHMAVMVKGTHSLIQARYRAHQIEHMPQNLVQVSLQAILGR